MAIDFPDSPSVNDTHTVLGRTWKWNGESWKVVGSAVRGISLRVSDTAPSDPAPVSGDMWYESDTGRTFTYYDSTWVELGNTASVTSFLADADADTRIHVEESADEDTIRFDTAGTERMTISSTGAVAMAGDLTVDIDTLAVDSTNNRVGIGTSSPNAPLEINGSINTELLRLSAPLTTSNQTNFITMVDSQDGDIVAAIGVGSDIGGANDNDGGILFATTTAATGSIPSTRMYINYAGNVGIGTTSPNRTLHVDSGDVGIAATFQSSLATGGISLMGSGTTDDTRVRIGAEGDDLKLFSNNIERMRIDSSGNVGINDSAPSYKLDVNGDARFTGSFYLTGFASVPVAEWQSYTPGLSTATLGNGSTTGYYMRVGNIIHAYARFDLGSTSGWDNRFSRISTPVTAKNSGSTSTQDNANIIQVEVNDSSAALNYIMGGYIYDSGANFRISGWRAIDATANSGIRSGYFLDLSNDVTLGDGDSVTIKAIYMADD